MTDAHAGATAQADVARLRDLHAQWIWGWDKAPGANWDFGEVQGSFYDWSSDACRFYDDMDPELRIVRSAEEYRRIWEPVFSSVREAAHGIEDGPEVLVDRDLASSRLVFIARITAADGTTTGIRTHNSLVWRRNEPDSWVIVGDHTTSRVIDAETTDRLLAALPGAATWAATTPTAPPDGSGTAPAPHSHTPQATSSEGTA